MARASHNELLIDLKDELAATLREIVQARSAYVSALLVARHS